MLGPILQSVARAAGPSLGRIFAQAAVSTAAAAAVGGAIHAGKKIYEHSRQGKYQCNKCGREFRGTPGTDMYCPGCGKRLHLN